MTEPRATYDAGTPTTAVSPYQEIELIAMDAVDLYVAYAKTRGHTQEGSRIKALEKVAESLLRPSPTLAAMLAADALLHACRCTLFYLSEIPGEIDSAVYQRLSAAVTQAMGRPWSEYWSESTGKPWPPHVGSRQ